MSMRLNVLFSDWLRRIRDAKSHMINRYPICYVAVSGAASTSKLLKNSFINLASASAFSFTAPLKASKYSISTTGELFSSWDFIEVNRCGLFVQTFLISTYDFRCHHH